MSVADRITEAYERLPGEYRQIEEAFERLPAQYREKPAAEPEPVEPGQEERAERLVEAAAIDAEAQNARPLLGKLGAGIIGAPLAAMTAVPAAGLKVAGLYPEKLSEWPWWGEVSSSLVSGALRTAAGSARGIGETLRRVRGDWAFDPHGLGLPPAALFLEEARALEQATQRPALREPPGLVEGKSLGEIVSDPRWWIRVTGQMGPQVAGGMVMHMLGGPYANFAYMASLEGGHQYQEAKAGGASDNAAFAEAAAVGLVNGLLEAATLNRAMRRILKTPGGERAARELAQKARTIFTEALKQGGWESATEAVQEAWSAFVSKLGHRPDMPLREIWRRGALGGLAALPIGLGLGGVSGVGGLSMDMRQQFEQAAQELGVTPDQLAAALRKSESASRGDVAEAVGLERNRLPAGLLRQESREALVQAAKETEPPPEGRARQTELPATVQQTLITEPGPTEQIRFTEEQIRALEERLEQEPESPRSVQAVEAELAELEEAALRLGASEADALIAERKPARELVQEAKRLGQRITDEEYELIQRIERADKRIAEIRDEVGELGVPERPPTPLADWLGRPGETPTRVYYQPGKGGTQYGTEIQEALEGTDISIRRYFHKLGEGEHPGRLRDTSITSFDDLLVQMESAGLIPKGLEITDVIDRLKRERQQRRAWAQRWSRPDTVEEQLRELALQEEQQQIEEGEEGPLEYGQMLQDWKQAWGERHEAAQELRQQWLQRRAATYYERLQARAEELRDQLADLEELNRQSVEAEREAVRRAIKRKRQHLEQLQLAQHKRHGVADLRNYIAGTISMRGLTNRQVGEIVARYAEPGPRGGKTTDLDAVDDAQALLQIAAAVEKARPPKYLGGPNKGEAVITEKTERKIQTLRKNLSLYGQETREDFARQIREAGMYEPRYVNAREGATEAQGQALLKAMLTEAEFVGYRARLERALDNHPELRERIEAIRQEAEEHRTAMAEKGKKGGVRGKVQEAKDARYLILDVERDTGENFYLPWLAALKGKRDAEFGMSAEFDYLAERVDDEQAYIEAIRSDEAGERVRRYIASHLEREGAPEVPEGLSEVERQIGDLTIERLMAHRNNVRLERFFSWWYDNTYEIPDAPEADLQRAKGVFETRGFEALQEYLATKTWGVKDTKGYIPERALVARVKVSEPPATIPTGVRDVQVKQATFTEEQQRSFWRQLHIYYTQRYNALLLRPYVDYFIHRYAQVRDQLADVSRTNRALSSIFSHLAGWQRPSAWTRPLGMLYRHSLAAVVLADPYKFTRNMAQPFAFYPDKTDLIDVRNRRLTTEEGQYYKRYASELGGIRRTFMWQEAKALPGFRWLMDFVNRVAPYGWSDEWGREMSYWAMINRVDRALKASRAEDGTYDVDKLWRRARLDDFEARQQRHALEVLALEGEPAFRMYLAHQRALNVHFAYSRAQRSILEQGPVGKIVGNLLTFPRSYTQHVALQTRRLTARDSTPYQRWRAAWVLLNMVGAAWLLGYFLRRLWGRKYNPYAPHYITGWVPGGLMVTGVWQHVSALWRAVGSAASAAVMGDVEQRDRAMRALLNEATEIPAMLVPFYRELVAGLEAVFDQENIDKYQLRKVMRLLDARVEKVPVRRTLIEKLQAGLFKGAGKWDLEEKYNATLGAINHARLHGVDLADIRGTGKGGKVTKPDVVEYLKTRALIGATE